MKKLFDWFFYLLGLIVFSSFIHELYHYSFCGGEFVAGFGFVKDRIVYGGLTWCAGNNFGGELIPSILELLIVISGIYLKIHA